MHNYTEVAPALGHDVKLYGPPAPGSFDYSLQVDRADAVVFIFEWTTALQYGDGLDLAHLVATVPRERRVVIDCDGKYNDAVTVAGDANHADAAASTHWVQVCDIFQSGHVLPSTGLPRL